MVNGKLIDLYLYEDDRENVRSVVVKQRDLSTLQWYHNDVGDIDLDAYFEVIGRILTGQLSLSREVLVGSRDTADDGLVVTGDVILILSDVRDCTEITVGHVPQAIRLTPFVGDTPQGGGFLKERTTGIIGNGTGGSRRGGSRRKWEGGWY